MELFALSGWAVTLILVVTLPWPLNIPLMALAYKIRCGAEEVDLETTEYWTRSAIGSGGLAGMSLAMLALGYALAVGLEVPSGVALLLVVIVYIPSSIAYVSWSFGLDELVDGLGVLIAYLLVPGLPLLLIGRFLGLWRGLAAQFPWLLPS